MRRNELGTTKQCIVPVTGFKFDKSGFSNSAFTKEKSLFQTRKKKKKGAALKRIEHHLPEDKTIPQVESASKLVISPRTDQHVLTRLR